MPYTSHLLCMRLLLSPRKWSQAPTSVGTLSGYIYIYNKIFFNYIHLKTHQQCICRNHERCDLILAILEVLSTTINNWPYFDLVAILLFNQINQYGNASFCLLEKATPNMPMNTSRSSNCTNLFTIVILLLYLCACEWHVLLTCEWKWNYSLYKRMGGESFSPSGCTCCVSLHCHPLTIVAICS